MDKEKDELICKTFPLLYRDRHASARVTCMCWGFPGTGWFQLIWDLSVQLEALIAAMPAHCSCEHPQHEGVCNAPFDDDSGPCCCDQYQDGRPCAAQVKEKFGGLRFYMTTGTREMYDLIDKAAALSYQTCEDCGQPGETRGGGWIRVLCNDCDATAEQRRLAELEQYRIEQKFRKQWDKTYVESPTEKRWEAYNRAVKEWRAKGCPTE